MSYSFFDNRMSYTEYMMAHDFVEDIKSTTNSASQRLSMDISRQTRDVIASNEALTADNIRATEIAAGQISDAMNQGFGELSSTMQNGFSRLSYDMQEISSGISELNATFHWGFGQMIASMGRMNDSLAELIQIAKTPAQTAAYEQYEIARDALRRKLFAECIEAIDKSIHGDQASSGYKLEWRFHQLKGTVQLGFVGCDPSLINLADAEQSFLAAARYAEVDFPEHAAKAFLSAGWAAYCQGKIKDGLALTEKALAINPNLGEALFQAAKVHMALGEVDSALPILGKAIDIDRFYAVKAAGDGDFQRYDDKLCGFLDAMRKEKYRLAISMVKDGVEKFRFWMENALEAKCNAGIRNLSEFIVKGENWPLLDILKTVHTLPELLVEIELSAETAILYHFENTTALSVTYEENCPTEETYQEEVVVKPGGIFRRAVTELQTKKRTVIKRVTQNKVLQGIHLYQCNGMKKIITDFEFCLIPSGTFMMGENNNYQVTISADFYLVKYPVTNNQWQSVMGHNVGSNDCPVKNVSWDDCQEFIKRINATDKGTFRLPTEAEWEYACRAASITKYCFGHSDGQLREYAWYSTNSMAKTQPVGMKKSNSWGLHDMYGNVWEWCQDLYGAYQSGEATDPQGASFGASRVYRGGSWRSNADIACSAHRHGATPDTRYDDLGFRLVCLSVR